MDSFSTSKTTGNFSLLFDMKSSVMDIAVDGWLRANTGLVLLEGSNTILRRDYRSLKKVRLLSGCMSGLEPMCSGFVGPGMLTAAVIGDKYMAPPYPNIVAALRELNSVYGTLIIVMNHPSLRINFSLAVEVVQREGVHVKVIFISDDCSGHIDRTSGRKGLAGTVLIYKIAGALADKNRSVDEIYKICSEICGGGLSTIISNFIGDKHNLVKSFDNVIFSLEDIYDSENISTTNVKKLFQVKTDLPEGSVEGSGCMYHHKFVNVDEFTKVLLGYVLDGVFSENSVVIEPDKGVVVLFNNYGSIVNYELHAFVHEVTKEIENRGIKIVRVYIGSVIINGSFSLSITVMKVTEEIIELLDHPTEVSSWPANCLSRSAGASSSLPRSIKGQFMFTNSEVKLIGPILPDKQADRLFRMMENVVMALISCEEQINKMGANSSMSLYGSYVKSGAEAINRALYESKLQVNCPYALFQQLSTLTSYHFPDVSGSCYAVFFDGASQVFLKYFHQSEVTPQLWVDALEGGINALEFFTKMKKGDRTMLDALYPAFEAMKKFPEDYSEVAEAAELGSLNTVDSSSKKHQLPDLGSHVVAIWMRAAVEGLKIMDDQYTVSEEFDESSEDIFVV